MMPSLFLMHEIREFWRRRGRLSISLQHPCISSCHTYLGCFVLPSLINQGNEDCSRKPAIIDLSLSVSRRIARILRTLEALANLPSFPENVLNTKIQISTPSSSTSKKEQCNLGREIKTVEQQHVVFVYGVLPDQAFKTCTQKEREDGNLQNKIRAQKKKAPEPIYRERVATETREIYPQNPCLHLKR
jgi:hypothetical protein